MELEQGKDYKTIFLDEPVKCFYASKIFWQHVDILEVEHTTDEGKTYYYSSIVEDPEEVARRYVEQRYKDDVENYKNRIDNVRYGSYNRMLPFNINVSSSDSVAECEEHLNVSYDDEEYWSNVFAERGKELPQKPRKMEVSEVIPMVKKKTVKAQMDKMVICCPVCHKVHLLEDFVVVKPEAKETIESLKRRYGESWYSLCEISRANTRLIDYLEGIEYDNTGKPIDGTIPFVGVRKQVYYSSEPGAPNTYFSPKLVCPECGCLINTYESKRLSIFYKYTSDNTRLAALTVFNDKKKVAAVGLYRTYYINVDALKISRQEFRMRLTFNTETGQSYFVGPKTVNGRKLSGWHYFKLMCITYRFSEYPHVLVHELFTNEFLKKEVFRALVKKFKGTIEQFNAFPTTFIEEGDESRDWIDNIDFLNVPLSCITLYNRFHHLDGKQLLCLSSRGNYMGDPTYAMKHLFAHVDKDASMQEILDTIVGNLHISNSKAVRKRLSDNLQSGCYLLNFTRFGFKDINIIQRFMELMDREKAYTLIFNSMDRADVKTFVKDMIKRKGESKTFDSIFATDCGDSCARYLVDVARMYVKFKEADMLIKEYYRDNLYKIHQRMVKDYTKIQFANTEIKYRKGATNLNMTIQDEFEFVLAKDTNELVRIGQVMGICVGGYRDTALRGSSIIVAMKQGGKYVGCIELAQDMRTLRQAKALYNNLLQERKAEALKEWVETLNLNTDGCYDYQHIKKGNIEYNEDAIYNGAHDYHHYELDEEGNVYDRNYQPIQDDDDVDDEDLDFENEAPFN